MKSCLLIGASGNPNFGDEAIMRVWINNYQSILQERMIFCDAWGGELKHCIELMHVNDVFVASEGQSIFKTTKYFNIENDQISITDIDEYINNIRLIAHNLKECGVGFIHLFGGGYINSMWPQTYILILSSLLVACELRIPVFATGLGLLPCKPAYYDFLKLFNYFALCDVRDQESLNLLSIHKESNLSYSGDDVLLAFDAKENYLVKEEQTPSLVVCLQNDLFPGGDVLSEMLSEDFLSIFIKKGIKNLKFISAMHLDSLIEQQDTIERINSYGLSVSHVDSFALIEQGIPVHKDSFFITSRYHIHLIASLWGCKGIVLFNNEYYKIKHTSVNMMGSAWETIGLDNAEELFSDIEGMTKMINSALSNNQDVKKSYISKKLELREEIVKQIKNDHDYDFNLDMVFDLIKILKH